MVDVEAMELTGERRRFDRLTAAAVMVAVDAVLYLVIAIVGVPFLMFVFADETGTWQRLWPYVGSWVLLCVGGAACAAAAFGLTRNAAPPARQAGAVAALGAAVVAVLVSLLMWPTATVGPAGAVLVVLNLVAALTLFTTKEPSLVRSQPAFPPHEPPPFPNLPAVVETVAAPVEADEMYRRPEPPVADNTRPTIDLRVDGRRPGTARRRPRTRAALHTLGGVTLPPRARRARRP
ncbi:hypothetical protein ACGFJ7_17975 [Actinoplanes sp. NPDC048988]|uniref:hypothetical protein n=1 Tax=Actinoplanes sp. NPDC048988 TaxID=3363901 RepID=UPI003714EC27